VQSTPNPSGALFSELNGVSCASASACTAVGYYGISFNGFTYNEGTLAEAWNGTTWVIQPTPSL
jgi:hypothetical protein